MSFISYMCPSYFIWCSVHLLWYEATIQADLPLTTWALSNQRLPPFKIHFAGSTVTLNPVQRACTSAAEINKTNFARSASRYATHKSDRSGSPNYCNGRHKWPALAFMQPSYSWLTSRASLQTRAISGKPELPFTSGFLLAPTEIQASAMSNNNNRLSLSRLICISSNAQTRDHGVRGQRLKSLFEFMCS